MKWPTQYHIKIMNFWVLWPNIIFLHSSTIFKSFTTPLVPSSCKKQGEVNFGNVNWTTILQFDPWMFDIWQFSNDMALVICKWVFYPFWLFSYFACKYDFLVVLGRIQYLPNTISKSWIFGSYDPIPFFYIQIQYLSHLPHL